MIWVGEQFPAFPTDYPHCLIAGRIYGNYELWIRKESASRIENFLSGQSLELLDIYAEGLPPLESTDSRAPEDEPPIFMPRNFQERYRYEERKTLIRFFRAAARVNRWISDYRLPRPWAAPEEVDDLFVHDRFNRPL